MGSGSDFQFVQSQEQRQLFSQTQIQALRLLAMPAQELRDFLIEASYSNPMIELTEVREEDPSRQYARKSDPSADYSVVENTSADNTDEFSELLLLQIRLLKLSRKEAVICAYIVENLNSRGWLDVELDDIAEELHVSVKSAAAGLKTVQSLNPAGVAARSLKECLQLQLERMGKRTEETDLLLDDGLELIESGNLKAVAKLLGCEEAHAAELVRLVKSLNPIPSSGASQGEVTQYIVPDASVFVVDGQLVLQINTSYIPRPVYSEVYNSLMDGIAGEDKKYLSMMKRNATQIISGYERRMTTFRRVMEVIVQMQTAYFSSGSDLYPMRMQDIADAVEMNVSTVSRAISNKYVQCRSGTVELSTLFTSAISSAGGNISSSEVKRLLQSMISEESRKAPLSDEQLSVKLKNRGIKVSRRTIAKYRDQLSIPPAFQRRRTYMLQSPEIDNDQ